MSTAKHYSFCSGPMRGKPVTALPGIGETYGDRLASAGYSMASDIYEKFKSLGFESIKCQSWLNLICGTNSRCSSMCYEALKEWHVQFGHTQTPPKMTYAPKLEAQYEYRSPRPRLDSYGTHETHHLDSPARSRPDSDITREEVLEIMAQFQKKQDSMTARIMTLEQEKSIAKTEINSLEKEQSKTSIYVKTLEAKVKQTDRMATVLQKQQNTSVELYKNVSNSIYLISQKLDETRTKQNDANYDSIVSNFIKILEVRIERIEESVKKYQKEQDKILLEFAKKINGNIDSRVDINKNITTSINILSRKLDDLTENIAYKKPVTENLLESKIYQIEKELSHLTTQLSELMTSQSSKKKEMFNKTCVNNTETLNMDAVIATKKNYKVDLSKLSSVILDDEVVEQIKVSRYPFKGDFSVSKPTSFVLGLLEIRENKNQSLDG